MPPKHIPRRVRGAKAEKISTQLFDYQIRLIKELSKTTGWSNGIVYRYALDYFIVCFKNTFKARGITLPEELMAMSERELRELAQVTTTE